MIARTAGMLIVAALLTGTAVAFARALSADSEFQSRRFLLKAEALRVELERSFEESERLAKALSVDDANPPKLASEIQRALLAIDDRLRQTNRLPCGAESACELKENLIASHRELRSALDDLNEPISLQRWSAHTLAADRFAAQFDRALPRLAEQLKIPLNGPPDRPPAP